MNTSTVFFYFTCKRDMPLKTSTNLSLAPCSFCERKPGFFQSGLNYCYVHWYSMVKSEEKKKKTQIHTVIPQGDVPVQT